MTLPGHPVSAHIAFLLTLGLSIYVWAWGSVRAGFEPFFTNVTRASGFDFTHFNGMSGEFYLPEIMGPVLRCWTMTATAI